MFAEVRNYSGLKIRSHLRSTSSSSRFHEIPTPELFSAALDELLKAFGLTGEDMDRAADERGAERETSRLGKVLTECQMFK